MSQFFILSDSGKPIYSKPHCDDSTITALFQSFLEVFKEIDSRLEYFELGDKVFTFREHEQIILASISSKGIPHKFLIKQLEYIYHQFLSLTTKSHLSKLWKEQKNFDYRKLIIGAEFMLDSFVSGLGHLNYAMDAYEVKSLPANLRNEITRQIIVSPEIVSSYIFYTQFNDCKLVATTDNVRRTEDIMILRNLLKGEHTGESWIPVCLPKYDDTRFVHCYISHFAEDLCLIIVCNDKNSFFVCSEAKEAFVQSLKHTNCFYKLVDSVKIDDYDISSLNISGIRHFIYKNNMLRQFTMPKYTIPYTSETEIASLQSIYQQLYFDDNATLHLNTDNETFTCLKTELYNVYVVFEPFCSNGEVLKKIDLLMLWLKEVENDLFF